MKNKRKIFSTFHIVNAIIMMMALSWLTIATPFVCKAQKSLIEKAAEFPSQEDEEMSLGENNTEEKTQNSTSNFSEYLHESSVFRLNESDLLKHKFAHEGNAYKDFYSELQTPPPEFLS